MSVRGLALDWSLDGPIAGVFLVLTLAAGLLYLVAARVGTARDRRHRRWPRGRTVYFLAGLAALTVDLYSGIGTEADTRLSVHMLEHMIMWVVVAPLVAAGAPLRLALFALPSTKRRTLARWLHTAPVRALTGPVGSVSLFIGVLLITHLPTIYGLTLHNDYVHEVEHGFYLLTALLVWAPFLGADPLPHRLGPRGQVACMAACMLPMALIALWLGTAAHAIYGHYLQTTGTAALHDQRVAAMIMWAACLPAFAAPVLWRARIPQWRRLQQQVSSQQTAA